MKDRLTASEFIVFIPIKFNQSTVMWNLHKTQKKTESIRDPALPWYLLIDDMNTSIFHDFNFLIAADEFNGIRQTQRVKIHAAYLQLYISLYLIDFKLSGL
jgi:hypothetical protein